MIYFRKLQCLKGVKVMELGLMVDFRCQGIETECGEVLTVSEASKSG